MSVDLTKPLEIAEDVFWVGYVVPNDPFQCHVYLIRDGESSVLIDPGSMITFPVVLEKIFQVIPLRNIKYIIMHHQDPDIVGCYSTLESLFPKGKRFVVTHWRTKTLLKHYQWKTPFYLIDQHNWRLKTESRELEFVFTPYAHFPGAFCTYDKKTKTLFSSDIFGSISDRFFLFAEDDEEYYEGVELFHKHYMPSRIILNHALDKIEEKEPELIAPQHGSIIKKGMIKPIIERLRNLDCGLYMLDEKESNVFTLNKLDDLLKRVYRSVLSSSEFSIIAETLFENIKKEIPTVEKIVVTGKSPSVPVKEILVVEINDGKTLKKEFLTESVHFDSYVYKETLETEKDKIGDIYIFGKKLSDKDVEFLSLLFKHIKYALAVSLERELNYEFMEREKRELKTKALTDPLTGLYNRKYLFEYLRKSIKKSHTQNIPVSVAIIDLDYFKDINDTYGHLIGDCVLKQFSEIFKKAFRSSDCTSRYGGEEFVVVMPSSDLKNACNKIENFRKEIEEKTFCEEKGIKITVSAGVTEYKEGMTIKELLEKADKNLYTAKKMGRNAVVCK
ncbi:diguanylate cyclase (GGDEF) domain-containing protein [Persephonella hydrogeniphila]|uniref:diguanylate cyclase n=1 Tax=Persephonella hydrogeniphila TaxID=198703 RepID=A0A285NGH4_9AQUI|nr:diguanylate cyclase [Persephonella hydrogeniphila]SNZ08549.1 diguanylate cyclase (GGDEF) domain-containing protein [Persephonella hydrogeniphila]